MPTQSKSTHTPGPWEVNNNIGRKGEVGIIADKAPCIVAIMGNQKEWPLEAEANAALIAAAPELLEVLRNVAGLLPVAARLHPDDLFKLQTDVVAAIRKAEGGLK